MTLAEASRGLGVCMRAGMQIWPPRWRRSILLRTFPSEVSPVLGVPAGALCSCSATKCAGNPVDGKVHYQPGWLNEGRTPLRPLRIAVGAGAADFGHGRPTHSACASTGCLCSCPSGRGRRRTVTFNRSDVMGPRSRGPAPPPHRGQIAQSKGRRKPSPPASKPFRQSPSPPTCPATRNTSRASRE